MKLGIVAIALLGLVLGAKGDGLCGCQPDPEGPLCASDYKTYRSECEMQCYSKNHSAYMLWRGTCENPNADYDPFVNVPVVNPYFTGPVIRPIPDGRVVNPYFTGPVIRPIPDGPVINPYFTGPVIRPIPDGPVVNPYFTGPVIRSIPDGPVVNPYFTGPVIRPIPDGPVVRPIYDGNLDAFQN